MSRWHSDVPIVDWDNPKSWGKDDITGLPVMHNDMIKQMEYGPLGLYWTGFMVHFADADQPNPQLVPPRLRPDPVPIMNPRHFTQRVLPNIPTGLARSGTITQTTIPITWTPVTSGLQVNSYVVNCVSFFNPNITNLTFQDITSFSPYTISGLTSGSQYLISVASVNNVTGQSAYCSQISLTTT